MSAARIELQAAVPGDITLRRAADGEPLSILELRGMVAETEADLLRFMQDPRWRLYSGQLYKILIKGDDETDEGSVVPFLPNRAQRRLVANLWHRNIIVKARQRGFTTLVTILWLDHALWNANQRCGIIAQGREQAKVIFRDKVRFAWENLPPVLRERMPLAASNADELLFGHNNSSIRVATSMRSGTLHRLLVSEFGKICAKFPDKAEEVITGSLPAVPLSGIAIIESTAEGRDGPFYVMSAAAKADQEAGKTLTPRDYRLHFSAWWEDPGYRLPLIAGDVLLTKRDLKYFTEVEAKTGRTLDIEQRRWYVATRQSEFGGSAETMWREYPSYFEEAFAVSTEGVYYAEQLAQARIDGRITKVPYIEGIPVNSFWDIGAGDGTGIWLHQRVGFYDHFIGFIEGVGEPYAFYIAEMAKLGYVWGTHHLPHDADHERQQSHALVKPINELHAFKLGGRWVIVDRVDDVNNGIQATRQKFNRYRFDEEACKAGLDHLQSYRKQWNTAMGCWSSQPRHDHHSEAADALRQHGQGYVPPTAYDDDRPRRARANAATA